MITSNYQVDGDIYSFADKFFCDSNDDKPSNADARDGLINGAILEETDTGKTYIFDKKANKWTEKAAGGGGGTGGSTTLSGLTDVDISNPSDGQMLVYNSTSGKWENGAGAGSPVMTVNLVYDEQTEKVTLDKTWQEIDTALRAGKIVYGVWSDGDAVSNDIVFSAGEPGSDDQHPSVYWVSMLNIFAGTGSNMVFVCDTASGYPAD